MKTLIQIYSPVDEPDESDVSAPPKDPAFLDVRDLCVPLGGCLTVSLGPVDLSVCKWLAENRFDQALVQVPKSEIGWRLVARTKLERLAADGHPLTDDPESFLLNDMCDVGSFGYPSVTGLVDALTAASAVIAYGETHSFESGIEGAELQPSSRNVVIYGLIAISDLNKHPVRLAIYDCLARLERGLAHLVSAVFKEPWDWIQKLSQESQVRILGYMELSRRQDVGHEPVAGAMLPDLLNVIAKTPDLLGRLRFKSRGEFDGSTGRMADIRNRVMHPVRPLVLGQEDVQSIGAMVRTTEDLSKRVTSALREIARQGAS